MKILEVKQAQGEHFPSGTVRVDYASGLDDFRDWAMLVPGPRNDVWVIVIHGHGSSGDQLFTRQDVRENWLPDFMDNGLSIVTFNLRGNAWMSPAAANDLHEFLAWLRKEYGMEKTVFVSGSMGGTSNLIYAVLHPEDVNAVIAYGAPADIGEYYRWCLQGQLPVLSEIAEAIKSSYGENSMTREEVFKKHSVFLNAYKLTMPVYLAHGELDIIMPVEQARRLAVRLKDKKDFFYTEIPGGNHDSPIYDEKGFPLILSMI
ncbi:MAG: alpha/beta hydrolase [Lentisphaerae bacterium]|nr:alpha/beta hydrolase [Lentisphaerota bacterium]